MFTISKIEIHFYSSLIRLYLFPRRADSKKQQ